MFRQLRRHREIPVAGESLRPDNVPKAFRLSHRNDPIVDMYEAATISNATAKGFIVSRAGSHKKLNRQVSKLTSK